MDMHSTVKIISCNSLNNGHVTRIKIAVFFTFLSDIV